MTKTVMGVRTQRYATGKGRWGPGRVHLLVYRKEAKVWTVYCRADNSGMLAYYGAMVADTTPVTCKKCLGSGLIK